MAPGQDDGGRSEDQDSLMVVDDTEILRNLQNNQPVNQNGGTSSHTQAINHGTPLSSAQPLNHPLSSPQAIPHPRLQGSTATAPALLTKPSVVNDSAARAAELRAKLLAKRPSTTASPRASPATKKAELPNATQTSVQELQQNGARTTEVKAEDVSKNGGLQSTAATKVDEGSTNKSKEQSRGQPVKDDELEHLFAQARNAASTTEADAKLTNGNGAGIANLQKPVDLSAVEVKMKSAVSDIRPALQKIPSSSEMSEGEIHSGPSSPTVARPPANTTEPKESQQVDQEKNEKRIRQVEVSKAYQPLKTPKQPTTDPGKAGPHVPDHSTAEQLPSPKLSNKQLKQQAWKQRNGYGGSHDIYTDSRRDREWDRDRNPTGSREDERESRRPSTSQVVPNSTQVERDARRKPSDDEKRRLQRTEDNARRAAEYKKNLEAQRVAASRKVSDGSKAQSSPTEVRRQEAEPRPSHTNQRSADRDESGPIKLRIDTYVPAAETATGEQDTDTVMLSPTGQTAEEDEDISDWLELTEYYDLAHRERRLTWFRKKRALDVQRAELEREEQLELQERSMLRRGQSVLPTNTPPKITRRASTVHAKMPPPPLPVKEANNVGIKIKDAALSAGLPTPTTSLKRPHAEDDLDVRRTQPADKLARTELNGYAANEKPLTSPASVKGEGRGDRYIPRQARSRSPGFRRRSLSPRRQRHSRSPSPYGNRIPSSGNGIPRYLRTCHNCNQQGHIVNECTEPRRDGKDWNRQNDYQQWVSPNYRGRNPVAGLRGGGNRSPHPRGGGAGNRPRYNSIGRSDDGEMVGARENNIESSSLKLTDGGQSRR